MARYTKRGSSRYARRVKNYRKGTKARRTQRYNQNRQMSLYRPITGFPNSKIVKMRYVEQVQINPTVAVFAAYQFRANGINDPNYTGTGHQPLGHDEWATMYRKNEVIGSKITAQCYNPLTANTSVDNALVCLELDDTTGFPADPTTHMEAGRTKVRLLVGGYGHRTSSVTLRKGFSAKKAFGRKYDRDLNRCAFGANPSQGFWYSILAAAADGISDPSQINIIVTIDYIVRLFERNDLAQS